MKIIILKKNLHEGLMLAERIIPRIPSLPILSTCLCATESNGIQISATDLEIGVRYKILSKNEKEGSVAVSPRTLSQFINALPEGPVALEKKGDTLEVGAEEFQAVLKTVNPDDFPLIPFPQGDEDSATLETQIFCEALGSVAGFVGQSQARPEISGVLFSFSKKTLTLASTDSFRLAEKTTALSKEPKAAQSFILPSKTARELLSLFSGRGGALTIFISATQAVFDYTRQGIPDEPRIQVVSRLIEGEYPRYQEVIPPSFQTQATFVKSSFSDRLKAAGIFSGQMNDVLLSFDPTKKHMEIFTKNPAVGQQRSSLAGDVQGEKLEVSFNWRFLGDGLAQMKGERVQFNVSSADGPALMKSTQDPSYLYVLMPLKM